MDIDIYIEEKTGGRSMRIPWIPESITFDSNETRFAKYEILKVGEVYIPSGANIHSYAWKSLLPGVGRRDDILQRGEWQDPLWYQQIWSAWRDYGTPLHLLVTGTPINHDVYLEDYSVNYKGAFGDYEYNISFVDARQISLQTVQPSGEADTATAAAQEAQGDTKRSETQSEQKTYTVTDSDTLWGIAQRFLGDGSQWDTIYNANRDAIENAAKQHGRSSSDQGHWIYAGTKLTIRK